MIKVVKFGGSSLASAEQFAKVGKIIHADKERRYVVPSAPGKRNSKDTKVTDMLYACYDLVEKDEDFRVMLMKIKDRYDTIINGLNLKLSLEEEFKKISENFKNKAGVDYAASRGEYLNGIIMANYLGYEFVDAAEVIFFDEDGNFMPEKTDKVLSERLAKTERAVIPGFYGAKEDGTIKTFSRGGSDITGSIVSRAVRATCYENWTDVSGFLIADPRIIDNPKPIKSSLTVNSASSPTWEPAYCMRMRYSLCAKLVYRSISVIRMHRKMREPGSWRAPAISQNIRSPVSQVKKVSFL